MFFLLSYVAKTTNLWFVTSRGDSLVYRFSFMARITNLYCYGVT